MDLRNYDLRTAERLNCFTVAGLRMRISRRCRLQAGLTNGLRHSTLSQCYTT